MTVFRHEIKLTLKSTVIWSAAMFLFIGLTISKFSVGNSAGADLLNQMIQDMPQSLQIILGYSYGLNMGHYYDYQLLCFQWTILILVVDAVLIAANILGRESNVKNIDFLYTKPMSNTAIYGQKFLAGLIHLVVVNGFCTAAYYCFSFVDRQFPMTLYQLVTLAAAQLAIMVFFYGLTFVLTAFKGPNTAINMGIGAMLVFYLLQKMILMLDHSMLSFLTPFLFFDPQQIVRDWPAIGLHFGVLILLSLVFYSLGSRHIKNREWLS